MTSIHTHTVHTEAALCKHENLPQAVITTSHTGSTGAVLVRIWEAATARMNYLNEGGAKAEVRLSITQAEALIEALTYAVNEAKWWTDTDIAAVSIINSIPE